MTIEMKPSSLGKTCGSNNVLFHINIGCPHSRHLRVKRPLICEDQNLTFIVPRKHTWFKTSKDLSIQYDQTTFGCPIDVHYGDPFRPLVMLFCDLSALFAVRTYGITESLSSIKIAVFSAMIIMLFLGVLVFSYFRYVTIFRTHSSDYRRLPLHSRLSSTSSADELKKEE